MKKHLLVFISIFLCFTLNAQDTNIVKYLPLKVGNIWVYSNGGSGIGKMRLKITNALLANGHLYYVFNLSGDSCHCAQGAYTPFLTPILPIRVDSLSGNVMYYGSSCQWQINEHLLDSLRTRVGVPNQNNACNFTTCFDTNVQNVFGTQVKTRNVGLNIMTYYSFRRYAYRIGLISSAQGCFYSTCIYTLLGCVIDGTVYGDTTFPVGIIQISSEIPQKFQLYQNYPNPFNPVTLIKFEIPNSKSETNTKTEIRIYDVLGGEITTLVNEQLSPGTYEVEFDGTNFPSGVYYYTLTSGEFKESKKMVLIK